MNIHDDEQVAADALGKGDYREAMRLLIPLAEQNSDYAFLSLGWIYETGAIGAADKDAARLYYSRAVDAGSASACFELGRLLLVQGEEDEARSVFELGAGRHDIACMSRLGRMMVEGRGGSVDVDTGVQWLTNAASHGHISAQRTLLKIEERDARTLLQKLSIKAKIALLVKKGTTEMLNDPRSDKVR